MISLKSAEEIEAIARAGRIAARTLELVAGEVRPGASTAELDRIAEAFIRDQPGAAPAFKGLYGFPATLCTSVNEEVVHGIPSRGRVLAEGDVVSVDVGVKLDGFFTDHAVTLPVGEVDDDAAALLDVTRTALERGMDQARPGGHVGDIGAAIQSYVEGRGFAVIRELVGHGVGHAAHEDPQVPNYGRPGHGQELREGLVIAIEPMVNAGGRRIRTLDDEWTVVTSDGSLSAHFENTVAVTADGPRVLTRTGPAAPGGRESTAEEEGQHVG
ncbi:MAG: type I methionyl aminopeptidase [Gemmatimonadota bacterium]